MVTNLRLNLTWILPLLFVAVFLSFKGSDYFSDQGGYRTKSGDILNHYYVIESIAHGELFPDWSKSEKSEHAVSNKLPVYHGLILAHTLSALFVSIGVPLPGSVLLVSDLAFLFSVFFLLMLIRGPSIVITWCIRVFGLLALAYVYLVQLSGAYFSQTVGMALGILLYYLISQKKAPRFCLMFLFIAAFAYPDTILVFAPLLAEPLWKHRYRIEFVLVCLLWLACLWIFVHRFGLPGPLSIDFSASYILFFILMGYKFFFYEEKPKYPQRELLFSYVLVLIFLTVYSFTQLNSFNYYLNKFTAWSYFILPIVMYQIREWKKQILTCFLFFIFFFSGIGNEGENKTLLVQSSQGGEINYLSNRSWREVRALISDPRFPKTNHIAPWISESDEKELNMSLIAILATARAFNLTSSLIHSEIFTEQNDGKPLGLARVHEKVRAIEAEGFDGLSRTIALLEKYPREVVIIRKTKWNASLNADLKFNSIESGDLVAVWKN